MNLMSNKYTIKQLEEYIANNVLTKDDWFDMVLYQTLTEPFMEKYSDKLNWVYVSAKQKLSEVFIEKFADMVDWCEISVFQVLSESFIERHTDRIYWYNIIFRQMLRYEFLEKHLYEYSLYLVGVGNIGPNGDNIRKLQEKYKAKYQIDKLEYELNK